MQYCNVADRVRIPVTMAVQL